MLKMTGIELELIADIEMYQFLEKWQEVFLTLLKNLVKQRINTYYNSIHIIYYNSKPSKDITHLGANYLYGSAMSNIYHMVGLNG